MLETIISAIFVSITHARKVPQTILNPYQIVINYDPKRYPDVSVNEYLNPENANLYGNARSMAHFKEHSIAITEYVVPALAELNGILNLSKQRYLTRLTGTQKKLEERFHFDPESYELHFGYFKGINSNQRIISRKGTENIDPHSPFRKQIIRDWIDDTCKGIHTNWWAKSVLSPSKFSQTDDFSNSLTKKDGKWQIKVTWDDDWMYIGIKDFRDSMRKRWDRFPILQVHQGLLDRWCDVNPQQESSPRCIQVPTFTLSRNG